MDAGRTKKELLPMKNIRSNPLYAIASAVLKKRMMSSTYTILCSPIFGTGVLGIRQSEDGRHYACASHSSAFAADIRLMLSSAYWDSGPPKVYRKNLPPAVLYRDSS